jgi:hypothetical protein
METELAVLPLIEPGPLSVVTATMRSEYAEAIAKTVHQVAAMNGLDDEWAKPIQAKMLHRLFHWICRQGTHFPHTAAVVERLERLAERLIEREVRRRNRERLRYGVEPLDDEETRRALTRSHRPRGPISIGILIKAWLQLTFAEQRVLTLYDWKYDTEEIALILDATPNAVEFYRNQGNAKLQQIYRSL